ncbi:unnamed protein product [Larinioides sclopetarius]|uniref:phospholipase D n=1 Tax=Larinioides sclopetarius TaxID=280406 RepID=A0AAV2B2K5_9ARAC
MRKRETSRGVGLRIPPNTGSRFQGLRACQQIRFFCSSPPALGMPLREGVQIYILLYKELEVALGINSYHTQKKLKKMHKNIKVIRHPEVSKGVLLWAHHEKIVCVDQSYAFVGGLDLCYGRWDDYQHRLSDFGEFEKKLHVLRHPSIPRKESSLLKETRSTSSVPELSSEVEMVKVQQTQPGNPETGHFRSAVRKYQATRTFKDIKKRLSMEAAMDEFQPEVEKLFSALQPSDRRRTIQEMALKALGMDRKFQLWHGKDYANFIFKDLYNLHQPYSDNIDRKVTPRMPWHDVGLFVQGKIARDIARHFILRWNHAKAEVCPRDSTYPYLMPKAYANLGDNLPSILADNITGTIFRAECQEQDIFSRVRRYPAPACLRGRAGHGNGHLHTGGLVLELQIHLQRTHFSLREAIQTHGRSITVYFLLWPAHSRSVKL